MLHIPFRLRPPLPRVMGWFASMGEYVSIICDLESPAASASRRIKKRRRGHRGTPGE